MAKPYRFLSALLALLLVPATGSARDHLVTPADVQARFAEADAERAGDIHVVLAALSRPAAAEAAAIVGVDLARIRGRLPALTDQELRDVAARAEALTVDPVAGANPWVIVLAVIGAIVVLSFVLAITCILQGECE